MFSSMSSPLGTPISSRIQCHFKRRISLPAVYHARFIHRNGIGYNLPSLYYITSSFWRSFWLLSEDCLLLKYYDMRRVSSFGTCLTIYWLLYKCILWDQWVIELTNSESSYTRSCRCQLLFYKSCFWNRSVILSVLYALTESKHLWAT